MLDVFFMHNPTQLDNFLAIWDQSEWTAYDNFGHSRLDVSYLVHCTLIETYSPIHEQLFLAWDNMVQGNIEVYKNRVDVFKQLISGVL